MTKLSDLINPPKPNMTADELYYLLNSYYDLFNNLIDISNISQLTNSDFESLSKGLTPTTQADGDDEEFVSDWFVVGATVATYTITPTEYLENSQVKSDSLYFVNTNLTAYTPPGFYFYQRQANTVRKYQNQFLTFTVQASNNLTELVKIRFTVIYNLGATTKTLQSKALYLEPGFNDLNVVIQTPSLRNEIVDASNYVEFRLEFVEIYTAPANIDFYELKAEFGKISTKLTS
jgi:hypothetical protein